MTRTSQVLNNQITCSAMSGGRHSGWQGSLLSKGSAASSAPSLPHTTVSWMTMSKRHMLKMFNLLKMFKELKTLKLFKERKTLKMFKVLRMIKTCQEQDTNLMFIALRARHHRQEKIRKREAKMPRWPEGRRDAWVRSLVSPRTWRGK